MTKWIKCSDKYPSENEPVLVWDGRSIKVDYVIICHQKPCWANVLLDDEKQNKVTHWHVMLKPPKESE